MKLENIKKFAKDNALITLDISFTARVGHVGSALSISDLVAVLYADRLNINLKNLDKSDRDRFILSKGHAAAALYASLYKKGIITKKILSTFARDNGGLCEHPEIKDRGIEMTSGSLGHGLGFGAGIAWGLKLSHLSSPHVFVLISDGEMGEGSVWEAALFASRMKLDNLTVVVDYNGWQCFGYSEEITGLDPLASKWKSFGFVVRSIDGHNIEQINNSYHEVPFIKTKPSVIIAKTISGHGIKEIEDKLEGHYKVFNKQEYQKARQDLESSNYD